MKKILKLSLLLFIVLLAFPDEADAQRRRKKKKKKKPAKQEQTIDWKHRMWYGGGFGVQFGSTGFGSGLNGNEFYLGISPMAGFKLTPWLSAGPRVDLLYLTGRYQFNNAGQVYKLNSFDYGIGPFVRAKTNFNIFGHIEYQYISQQFTDGQIKPDNTLNTIRQSDDAFYVGAGYNSSAGSLFGYEFYIVFDLLAPENTTNLPIQYRFGITYNF